MPRLLLPVLCLVSVCIGSAVAGKPDLQIDVGGVQLQISPPRGFYEITSVTPELKSFFETGTVASNRLLAVFGSENDLARAMNSEFPILERYAMLQVGLR